MSYRIKIFALAIVLAGTGVVVGGWTLHSAFISSAIAGVAVCLVGLALSPLPKSDDEGDATFQRKSKSQPRPPVQAPEKDPDRLLKCGHLVRNMVAEGRYALLLRKEIVENLDPAEQDATMNELEDFMGLVPQGRVVMEPWRINEHKAEADGRKLIDVEPLYVDRYPVTNAEYRAFVTAGGYEQPTLWCAELLPAVLQFVDQTGHPGPRFWENGEYAEGTDDHPVVGICWYEAEAYARWVGKRLPTSPEWVKAGAWPVEAGGKNPTQRKYPWGDAMDRNKANLWGSGFDTTCSVYDFIEGSSVNGLQQLVGNVWEWTTTDFVPKDELGQALDLPTPMKTIRGGAFDTYFDRQASIHFQSGDTLMARKHNIGFRCALSYCDVCFAEEGANNAYDDEEMTV